VKGNSHKKAQNSQNAFMNFVRFCGYFFSFGSNFSATELMQ